jgi:hypothetical protein
VLKKVFSPQFSATKLTDFAPRRNFENTAKMKFGTQAGVSLGPRLGIKIISMTASIFESLQYL